MKKATEKEIAEARAMQKAIAEINAKMINGAKKRDPKNSKKK